jgi:hypothetical protein
VTIRNSRGSVTEIRSASHDPTRYFALCAGGFDGTATVDAWVF